MDTEFIAFIALRSVFKLKHDSNGIHAAYLKTSVSELVRYALTCL